MSDDPVTTAHVHILSVGKRRGRLRGQDVRVMAVDPIGGGAELLLPCTSVTIDIPSRQGRVTATITVVVDKVDLDGVEAVIRLAGPAAIPTEIVDEDINQ